MSQQGPTVGFDDVAELRSLLRRRDRAAREIGLALLRSWSANDLGVTGARAVLEAAGGSYPDVEGSPEHPAELLARILWDAPETVEVRHVVRVYLIAGERSRRALIHLLALRGDASGLEGLEFVVGRDAPAELLPIPTTPLLDPLLEHPDRARVTALLLTLLPRADWTWHAARLLCRLQTDGVGDRTEREQILDVVTDCADSLVRECDVAAMADPRSGDAGRSPRQSLASLVWLLDEMDDLDQRAVLGRMLGSADPRVAAMAAVRLLGRDDPVAPDRLRLIARDPVARADLHDGLVSLAPQTAQALADDVLNDVAIAEGELARWLSEVTELGRAPDEMEHLVTVAAPDRPAEPLHVFRFRMNAPHWSASRGWMIGVAGAHVSTIYAAEDECPVAQHVTAVLAALADWPDRRADGAA